MPKYDEPLTIRHIAGNVGSDPEEKQGREGSTFVSFRLAVTRAYGDEPDATRWYSVAVNKDALQSEVLTNIRKGAKVVCEGTASSKESNGKTYYNFNAFRVGFIEWLVPSGSARKTTTRDDDDL